MSELNRPSVWAATLLLISITGLLVIDDSGSPAFIISSGLTVSLFTYFIVAWLPEKQRRNRVKKNLAKQYELFKEECISIFFSAMRSSYTMDQLEQLKQQAEFIRYFKEQVTEDEERWHVVLNGMNDRLVLRLVMEIEILVEEVRYALSVIDIENDEVFQFMKRLSQTVYAYRNFDDSYDDLKQLSQFMWSIHTGWSIVEGYTERDIIAEMIDAI